MQLFNTSDLFSSQSALRKILLIWNSLKASKPLLKLLWHLITTSRKFFRELYSASKKDYNYSLIEYTSGENKSVLFYSLFRNGLVIFKVTEAYGRKSFIVVSEISI